MKTDNIKKYCLHIVEAKDRLENIHHLVETYDIFNDLKICEFTKVSINKQIGDYLTILHTQFYDSYNTNYGNVFSCAYNWLQMLKCSYERGDEYTIFIEDDLYINVNNDELNNYICNILDDADIVKFTYNYESCNDYTRAWFDWFKHTIDYTNKLYDKIYIRQHPDKEVRHYDGHPSYNIGFILLSRRALKYVIDKLENEFNIPDTMFFDLPNYFNFYIVKNQLNVNKFENSLILDSNNNN